MNLMSNDMKEVFNLINNSKSICIAGHKAPDGDCIGSVMALYEIIKPLNKQIEIYIDGEIPYNYKLFIDEDLIAKKYNNEKFDLLVVLDCSDTQRLGKFEDVFKNANKTICIDHHKTNKGYADINIIDTSMSSTGELLFDVFMASEKKLTKEIARYLYIAILTDTGKFSYANTTSMTHLKAAKLIELGVDVADIDNIIYNSKPSNVVKAFIDCIANIELHYDNKFGLATITKSNLKNNNVNMQDLDGVVEFIREIKEVEVSCVLKEYEEKNTKVSLRAKGDIDVSNISVKFGGGGHSKAAGFEINETLENTKKLLIEIFKDIFKA